MQRYRRLCSSVVPGSCRVVKHTKWSVMVKIPWYFNTLSKVSLDDADHGSMGMRTMQDAAAVAEVTEVAGGLVHVALGL